MKKRSYIYSKHQDFVDSTIEAIVKSREHKKDHVIALVDSMVLNIKDDDSVSDYVCDKVCSILNENPDFIDDVLRYEPIPMKKWDGNFGKLTEDNRLIKNLEDILFYKSNFHGCLHYKKLISTVENGRKKLIL